MRLELRRRLQQVNRRWKADGLPSREVLDAAADDLRTWKKANRVESIWTQPCRMITATLDDGLGHGLALIERYAEVLGMAIDPLGLLQPPESIIAACAAAKPDFLGLTVLQPHSDDDLALVGKNLPVGTCLIAGGPAFRYDKEMADRCSVDHVAENVADFIDFALNWTPVPTEGPD
jgi:methylmalonyl-CoA mutase cobalamin-binding subunit